jgi:hypothetical protein
MLDPHKVGHKKQGAVLGMTAQLKLFESVGSVAYFTISWFDKASICCSAHIFI